MPTARPGCGMSPIPGTPFPSPSRCPPPPVSGSVGGPAVVTSIAFSADGHTLASADNNGDVRLWALINPAHPRLLRQIAVPGGPINNSMAFSRDGRTLAIGREGDGNNGDVQLWAVVNSAHPRLLGQAVIPGGPINSVAFS